MNSRGNYLIPIYGIEGVFLCGVLKSKSKRLKERVISKENEAHHQQYSGKDENLQIVVEPALRKRTKEEKTQHELEMAFRRRLNRDLKEKQLLLHKASLLFLFGRSYNYNRLLNDLSLMQASIKLLPGGKAYPRETGTELKYFQSFVTWFKTIVKLSSPNLYASDDKVGQTWAEIKEQLIDQIKKKEARCKQDMIFIFVTLMRGMGLQCRLVVNMQPLPLKPPQEDLLKIKLKADNIIQKAKSKESSKETKPAKEATTSKENKSQNSPNKNEHSYSSTEKATKENASGKKTEKPKASKGNKKEQSNKQEEENIKKEKETLSQKLTKKKEEVQNTKKEKETLSQKLARNDGKGKSKESDLDKTKNDKQANKADVEKETDKSNEGKSSTKKPTNLSKLKRPFTENLIEEDNPKKSKNTASTKTAPTASSTTAAAAPDEKIPNKVVPVILLEPENEQKTRKTRGKLAAKSTDVPTVCPTVQRMTRSRSRSTSPRPLIATEFLQTKALKEKLSPKTTATETNNKEKAKPKTASKPTAKKTDKVKTATDSLKNTQSTTTRVLRSRQNSNNNAKETIKNKLTVPQLDGADDELLKTQPKSKKRPQLENLKKPKKKSDDNNDDGDDDDDGESDADFEPSPPKQRKRAPVLPKKVENIRKDRRILSTDNENDAGTPSKSGLKKAQLADMWIEVWSDVENEWICVDLFKGKLHSVESIRKSASSSLAYVFAFQNDLSLKDVTARYCPNWSTTVRKNRVDSAWLETAISPYFGKRNDRDIREDHEMRRVHEQKPLPTSISDFKDHPLYALERHLLKFQAIYPPNPPTIGFTKTKEPIYSRDCVHTLHSREIWLKQARTVKLGEQPYKIVKARPKWDRLTQSVIKDQPLEIFGYWQTEDYEPPTAENGIVPRNAYGNVELFKECMLPKKTVHLRLPGLSRICKKLNIDCANAVVGFDFHQGSCHPMYDGFVVCEEFADQVTAAWHQDQEDQERKEQEKYEARVYGNWKKLIKGLLIRERIKKKYNF